MRPYEILTREPLFWDKIFTCAVPAMDFQGSHVALIHREDLPSTTEDPSLIHQNLQQPIGPIDSLLIPKGGAVKKFISYTIQWKQKTKRQGVSDEAQRRP